jgi:pilus assembly protein CpaE
MFNNNVIQIKLVAVNPELTRHFQKIVAPMEHVRLLGPDVVPSDSEAAADVAIFEIGPTPEKDFERIKILLSRSQTREVFITGENPAPDILMHAMRLGVKEFLPVPLNPEEIRNALKRVEERLETVSRETTPKKGKIISVCGSKGGVGTTTVAVNLAVAYAGGKSPLSVALMDMNTLFGEIPLFLEMSPKFHWGEITKNIDRLDDTFLMNVLTRHGSGVHVLPSPAYLNGHHMPTPDIMQRLLGLMRQLFDVVIIDGGQSMNDAALKGFQLSDAVLLVSILSLPCLSNTAKLLRSYIDMGYVKKEHIKVVINRYMKKAEIAVSDAEAGINQNIFWTIPNDYKTTMAAINGGQPLVQLAPKTEIAESFSNLAEKLIPSEGKHTRKRWSLFKR